MIQKMTIDIECNKILSDYGDGHTLVYNKDKNNYFIMTREEFLKPQNDKIKELEKSFNLLKENIENEINNIKKSQEDFTNSINKKFNDFLENYKQTNQKIIDLIKPLIAKENE